MRITVFGSGYVGLVTGACLADVGHIVQCVDIDERKIAKLNRGEMPIYEPGIEQLVKRNREAGRLLFSSDAEAGARFGDIIFIAVGTPPGEDGSADLKYVLTVADTIGEHMDRYKVVVNKSTVPVGTGDRVAWQIGEALRLRGESIDFDVCSNPEFLKEGSAIDDFTRAARIIVGTDSERVRHAMQECYAPYNRNHDKLMFMDVRAAELTKYAANTMLATRISLINEIANIAERLGTDVEQVRLGIGSDPRIGFHFIYPGAGYGGSCFPKDVRALIHTAENVGLEVPLISAVERTNEIQKTLLLRKLEQIFDGDLKNRTVAVWGLAFKPNTDDMREAPSRVLIEGLTALGAQVRAYDPKSTQIAREIFGNNARVTILDSQEDAVQGADALAICTEWKQFRIVDFDWLKSTLKHPIIVDGRNLYEPTALREHGLLYYAVGRGDSSSLYRGAN
ncbi:UDP-glucose dehydrogenase family protein [Devosia sp. A449]